MSSDLVQPDLIQKLLSPVNGIVIELLAKPGQKVAQGDLIALIESMKVQIRVEAEVAGEILESPVIEGDLVDTGSIIVVYRKNTEGTQSSPPAHLFNAPADHNCTESPTLNKTNHPTIKDWLSRASLVGDENRKSAVLKRHKNGYQTARENVACLCNPEDFIEYGQLAVAAQRQRQDYDTLKSTTAADGVITGIGEINTIPTALIVNDYTVLAGTQGYFHHQKIDRMLAVARQKKLPVIMFTEGGGGRPGDTDVLTVNSGLQCSSFSTWAGLKGVVPRIAVANGYNFAGNAALFGAADITIATRSSWIGMAGPAMISGGGLGNFKPSDIGPIETQSKNGVVDIVADNEKEACITAKKLLSLFYAKDQYEEDKEQTEQDKLRKLVPSNRKEAYAMREILNTVADAATFIELQRDFAKAMIVGFMQINGNSVGIIANDCMESGGAIDSDAGQKAAKFMQLCDDLKLPIVSFCDTPGFMVGPKHEENGAVRKLADLFAVGAKITVPFFGVVVRKCYGLGAQAMLGGSTHRPSCTLAWPSGEFGAMGLEGDVQLGFRKELDATANQAAKTELFNSLVAEQYEKGKAAEVASVLELDAVIDPAQTRSLLTTLLES